VATPAFSLAAGPYTTPQTVTITDATAGSSIYYTTDGSPPSLLSTLYSTPVLVAKNETLSAVALESGYSGSAVAAAAYTIAQPPVALTGTVTSGTWSVPGAHVYLLAASSTGYGGAGLAASSGNASVSLLNAADAGGSDSVGAYVVSQPNGGFSLTGDYNCTAGQQLYLYVLGGNGGAGVSSENGLMAAIGSCPAYTASAVSVTVNEVTTVAAAYALAGFATDATHVGSSGSALAQTGIANAFANAANLVTPGTGVARATTPAGNGTVPQAEINTLANILAGCVGAANLSSSPGCTTLFANAESGGTTGTVATDTATAAINIAHNPGVGVAALYGLTGSVYTPKLSAQPNDWTVALSFSGGGMSSPYGIAIDSSGDAWITNSTGNSVTELSSSGAPASGSPHSGGGLNYCQGIAIDHSGNVWVADDPSGTPATGGNSVTELSSSGSFVSGSPYTGGGLNYPGTIAIDGSGDAWITNSGANGVTEISGGGSLLSGTNGYSGGGLSAIAGLAIDGAGDAWATNGTGSSVTKLSSTGAFLSGTAGYTGGGLNVPYGVAIDASGNAWVSNTSGNSISELSNSGSLASGSPFSGGLHTPEGVAVDGSGNIWMTDLGSGSVTEFSNSGSVLSGTGGYMGGLVAPKSLAVDGSGDVWVINSSSNAAIEFVGVSTPVITPIAAGLPATPTANGSSKLGTRP
jgi:streptogramin lyase